MPSTKELNATGQFYEAQFKEAWRLFQEEKEFDQANDLCRELIMAPDIGVLHRAGCHLILAHSPDQYVHHAMRALQLYKNLYTDAPEEASEKQKKSQETLIKAAEGVLKKCLVDAIEYGEGEELDEAALQKDIDVAIADEEESEAAFLADMEDEEARESGEVTLPMHGSEPGETSEELPAGTPGTGGTGYEMDVDEDEVEMDVDEEEVEMDVDEEEGEITTRSSSILSSSQPPTPPITPAKPAARLA